MRLPPELRYFLNALPSSLLTLAETTEDCKNGFVFLDLLKFVLGYSSEDVSSPDISDEERVNGVLHQLGLLQGWHHLPKNLSEWNVARLITGNILDPIPPCMPNSVVCEDGDTSTILSLLHYFKHCIDESNSKTEAITKVLKETRSRDAFIQHNSNPSKADRIEESEILVPATAVPLPPPLEEVQRQSIPSPPTPAPASPLPQNRIKEHCLEVPRSEHELPKPQETPLVIRQTPNSPKTCVISSTMISKNVEEKIPQPKTPLHIQPTTKPELIRPRQHRKLPSSIKVSYNEKLISNLRNKDHHQMQRNPFIKQQQLHTKQNQTEKNHKNRNQQTKSHIQQMKRTSLPLDILEDRRCCDKKEVGASFSCLAKSSKIIDKEKQGISKEESIEKCLEQRKIKWFESRDMRRRKLQEKVDIMLEMLQLKLVTWMKSLGVRVEYSDIPLRGEMAFYSISKVASKRESFLNNPLYNGVALSELCAAILMQRHSTESKTNVVLIEKAPSQPSVHSNTMQNKSTHSTSSSSQYNCGRFVIRGTSSNNVKTNAAAVANFSLVIKYLKRLKIFRSQHWHDLISLVQWKQLTIEKMSQCIEMKINKDNVLYNSSKDQLIFDYSHVNVNENNIMCNDPEKSLNNCEKANQNRRSQDRNKMNNDNDEHSTHDNIILKFTLQDMVEIHEMFENQKGHLWSLYEDVFNTYSPILTRKECNPINAESYFDQFSNEVVKKQRPSFQQQFKQTNPNQKNILFPNKVQTELEYDCKTSSSSSVLQSLKEVTIPHSHHSVSFNLNQETIQTDHQKQDKEINELLSHKTKQANNMKKNTLSFGLTYQDDQPQLGYGHKMIQLRKTQNNMYKKKKDTPHDLCQNDEIDGGNGDSDHGCNENSEINTFDINQLFDAEEEEEINEEICRSNLNRNFKYTKNIENLYHITSIEAKEVNVELWLFQLGFSVGEFKVKTNNFFQCPFRNGLLLAELISLFQPHVAEHTKLKTEIFKHPKSMNEALENCRRVLWLLRLCLSPPIPTQLVQAPKQLLSGNKEMIFGLLYWLSQIYPFNDEKISPTRLKLSSFVKFIPFPNYKVQIEICQQIVKWFLDINVLSDIAGYVKRYDYPGGYDKAPLPFILDLKPFFINGLIICQICQLVHQARHHHLKYKSSDQSRRIVCFSWLLKPISDVSKISNISKAFDWLKRLKIGVHRSLQFEFSESSVFEVWCCDWSTIIKLCVALQNEFEQLIFSYLNCLEKKKEKNDQTIPREEEFEQASTLQHSNDRLIKVNQEGKIPHQDQDDEEEEVQKENVKKDRSALISNSASASSSAALISNTSSSLELDTTVTKGKGENKPTEIKESISLMRCRQTQPINFYDQCSSCDLFPLSVNVDENSNKPINQSLLTLNQPQDPSGIPFSFSSTPLFPSNYYWEKAMTGKRMDHVPPISSIRTPPSASFDLFP